MKLVKEKQLKKEYISFGRFYILKYDNQRQHDCRSVLEIFERNAYQEMKSTNKIDAVIIMMNPGSCKPKVTYNYDCKSLNQVEAGELNIIKLVEAEPDTTQYQVMRVMKIMGWKYVRVINLSDYINPESESFYEVIKELSSFDKIFFHSIFSEKRKKDIIEIFKSEKEFKVIAAWGVDTALELLIQRALKENNLNKRVGCDKTYINKKKQNFYYYHPLYHQEEWMNEIVEKL